MKINRRSFYVGLSFSAAALALAGCTAPHDKMAALITPSGVVIDDDKLAQIPASQVLIIAPSSIWIDQDASDHQRHPDPVSITNLPQNALKLQL